MTFSQIEIFNNVIGVLGIKLRLYQRDFLNTFPQIDGFKGFVENVSGLFVHNSDIRKIDLSTNHP